MSTLADEIHAAVQKAFETAIPRMVDEVLKRMGAGTEATDLLDVAAAARRLGLAVGTVYRKAAKCELPSVKLGERVLFRPADLDAYAEARRRSPERVRG